MYECEARGAHTVLFAAYSSQSFLMSVMSYSDTQLVKSLMADWLEQASQWQEMYCHDLEVMSSNLGQVELTWGT